MAATGLAEPGEKDDFAESEAEQREGGIWSEEPGDIGGELFDGIGKEEGAVDVENLRLNGGIEDVDGAAGGEEGIDGSGKTAGGAGGGDA